jgi:DNA-binding HxlR family transcriptional regulator
MSNPDEKITMRTRAPVPLDQCGLAYSASILGDRWTLLILREAFYGVRRFDDLQADLAAPRQALADRLERLVSFGLLLRQPYQEKGQRRRYEYHLTKKARDLIPALIALMEWGARETGIESPIRIVQKGTGATVLAAFIDEAKNIVPVDDIQIALK